MTKTPFTARICIVAENASTSLGGEAILPFHYFRVLRERGLDAWLCVHERCREDLLALFPHDHDRLLFVRDQWLQKLLFRIGKRLPRRVAEASLGLANQMLTQLAQRNAIHPILRGACVVHQPIPVAPRFPSLMYGLGCQVVIGPLNGGMEYPPAFRHAESLWSRAAIACGRALTDAVNIMLPGKRRAAIVLVANERTRAALPGELEGRVVTIPENGVDLKQWPSLEPSSSSTQASFAFIGRLVDWKRLDVVIEALASTEGATLDVVGDGPMRATWTELVKQRGLTTRVHFHGWLPQAQSANILATARALVLPSVYESGGAVVLEAMAAARAVIATDWGGPQEYLDETCGILIPPTSLDALTQGFAAAMQRLIANPDQAAKMGAAGRQKVRQHYDWDKKVDAMLLIYGGACGQAPAAGGSA